MTDTHELERRLQQTLRAKAAQADVADAEFDAASPLIEVALATRRPRRALIAVATALAVAAAATGVALVTRPQSHGPLVATKSSRTTPTPTSIAPSAPSPIAAPVLAPTWVPDGQKLWSLTSNTQEQYAESTQLFGTVGADGALAPGLLIEIQPASPGSGVGSGTAVTVRGHSGVTRASKDAGDAPFEIDWIEGNGDMRVTVRGATVAEAVTALDALRPRGGDLLAGFDPAAAPNPFPLLGERLSPAAKPDVYAQFEYSSSDPTAGAKPEFTVKSDVYGSYPGYLRTWMAGHRAADGTVVEYDPGAGFFVVWPDGRTAIAASSAPDPDLAVLEHIARSASVLQETDAAALAAEAQARVAALPVQGTTTLDAGVVDLRGAGSPTAVCVHVGAAAPACSNPFAINALDDASSGALPGYAGSSLIGGKWYVFVAANAAPTITKNGMPDGALATQTAQIGALHIALAVVPDGVDKVQIWVPTSENQSGGTGFTRPPS